MKLNEIYVVNVVNIDNLVYISRKVHLHFVLHTAYSHTCITEFGGLYFPNRSLLFVFILFTEMVACALEDRAQLQWRFLGRLADAFIVITIYVTLILLVTVYVYTITNFANVRSGFVHVLHSVSACGILLTWTSVLKLVV